MDGLRARKDVAGKGRIWQSWSRAPEPGTMMSQSSLPRSTWGSKVSIFKLEAEGMESVVPKQSQEKREGFGKLLRESVLIADQPSTEFDVRTLSFQSSHKAGK